MRSKVIPILFRELRARGLDTEALGRAHGLLSNTHELPEVWVSMDTLREVTDACAQLTGDASLGLHVGLSLERGAYGVIEFAARCVPTLRDALERLVKYATLVSELVSFEVEPVKGGVALHHGVPGERHAFGRQVNEFFLGLVVHLARELVGPQFVPLRAAVAHEGADCRELRRALGCEVRVSAGRNTLVFSTRDVDAPVVSADPALLRVLESFAASVASERPTHLGLLPQVRVVMRALFPAEPEVDRVAARLKMSRRTLQRRLAAEGVTFQQVLDQLRREVSVQALAEGRKTAAEIAWSVGYSDVRAFKRAHRRWMSEGSPAERS